MELIPVTSDLSVEIEEGRWRLVQEQDEGKSLRTVVEANPQQVTFDPDFVQERDLAGAQLSTSNVAKIVLGWAPEARSWELGLFLQTDSDLQWCALLRWQPSEALNRETTAKSVADALSQVLGRPLQVLDTRAKDMPEHTQPSQYTAPLSIRPIPTQKPPIKIGDWVVQPSLRGFVWELTPRWLMRFLGRSVVFFILFGIFVVLGFGSLSSGLASVYPSWLPYISFGVGLVVLYSALENAWQVIIRRRIVVDEEAAQIRSERVFTGGVEWQLDFDTVEYLLISQEESRPQGRKSRSDPMHIVQDIWAHIYDGNEFYLICALQDVEGRSWQWERVRRHTSANGRQPLNLTQYDTPLHHAVAYMGEVLSKEVYVDIR